MASLSPRGTIALLFCYKFVTHFQHPEERLIKKIISSFLIAVLLFAVFPLTAYVSAATLDNATVLNSISTIKTNTRFYGLGQCYGFARKTFADIYNLNIEDVSWDYDNGTTTSTYLYLVTKTESASELATVLNAAQPGDVICYGGGWGNPHSMIFVSKDDAAQEMTVLDANWGAYNIIQIHAIPYEQLSDILDSYNTLSLFRYTPAGLSLSADSVSLYFGDGSDTTSTQLTCIATPDTCTTPLWSSSDSAVAAVDQNGVITAVGVGSAVITCQVGDKIAQSAVTVAQYKKTATKYSLLSLIEMQLMLYNVGTDGIALYAQ